MTQAQQIRDLLDQGMEVKEIAKVLNIRYQQVRGVAVKHVVQKAREEQSTKKVSSITVMERKILIAGRITNFGDCLENAQWTFGVIEKTDIHEKSARGVLSSLVKKGYITVWDNDGETVMGYTEEGSRLFDDGTITLEEIAAAEKATSKD